MSIAIMTAVWEYADARDSELLVLLALADFANDEGISWPSVSTLARKARISDRQLHRVIGNLVARGIITRSLNAGPNGVNVYAVDRGVSSCHPVAGVRGVTSDAPGGVEQMSPKPSLEPSLLTGTTKRPPIFELYEQHVGTIDRHMADRLIEAEAEYSEECLRHSFAAASEHNVHNWKYVEAILQRHKTEGCYVKGPQKGRRGDGPKGSRSAAALNGPDLEPWRRYAAGEQ